MWLWLLPLSDPPASVQGVPWSVTAWFVPAVMAAAALTFLVWLVFGLDPALTFALVNAVAVLIIACPCAMGLATPTSIMVGTGRGAEMGVLFRKGEALQLLKDAKVVAVDKTGTLTEGRPVLTDLEIADGFDRNQVLAKVAAVESRSEHPIARAIVESAVEGGIALPTMTDFDSVTGMGVRATVDGARIEVGADRFMRELGLDVGGFARTAERLGNEGKSPLYAAIDGRLAAIIAVADPIKSSTPAAIAALHQLGLKVAMITGDNARTAQAIAKQLGIDEVVAEVLPEGKVEAVRRLKASHGQIAYVGDGNNVAASLLLAEAEALLPVTDVRAAKAALRDIQERWEAAGKVPRSQMQELEGRFRAVEIAGNAALGLAAVDGQQGDIDVMGTQALDHALVAPIVPGSRRAAWRAQWQGELWHYARWLATAEGSAARRSTDDAGRAAPRGASARAAARSPSGSRRGAARAGTGPRARGRSPRR